MKNIKKILAFFFTLTLLIAPPRVLAALPVIDMEEIDIFRPTGESVTAVSIPFGDADVIYWLLLDGADPGPANAAELKANPAAGQGNPGVGAAPRLYLEWSSLTLGAGYSLYLTAENGDGLSELCEYTFTHLLPPPEVEITSVELQTPASAEAGYIVRGMADAVYWLLVSDDGYYYPTEEQMRGANTAGASPGAHTLELSGFDPDTNYTLYMMAENETGCSFLWPLSFNTTILPPVVTGASVSGASAKAATVEMMVDFLVLPGGRVYMLALEADDPWPEDGAELKQKAQESGVSFPMDSGVKTHQLSGLTPETEYCVYITAESEAGFSNIEYVLFTTLADNAGDAPRITASPAHRTVSGTEEVSFTVEAFGEELNYRWQSIVPTYGERDWVGGSGIAWENLSNDGIISGADTERLIISASAFENGDYYNIAFRCVVTNGAGSVVSDPAVLAVEGLYPILKSVAGVPVGEHHPIGRGMNMHHRFEANVTVPHTTTELAVSDLVVDYTSGHTLQLYSGDDYLTARSSQTLTEGVNDVYFTIDNVEGGIYYHVTVTREAGISGGGSDPGGSSSGGDSGVPETGDRSDMGLWTVLLGVSVLGIAGIALCYRRRKDT